MSLDSEFIERDMMIDAHAAATPALVEALGLQALSIGSAFVSVAARLPASAIVINRTLCLGLAAAESEATVAEVVAAYRDAGVQRFFVHCHPDARPPQLGDWLVAAGLEKARAWQKFARGREALPELKTDLRIAEIGPEHGRAFGRIACDAFDLGDDAAPWLANLVGRPDWHVFMTFAGDEPAGAGALFVKDGIGALDFGCTAPRFRGRGSQTAVLNKRIERALDLGCLEIVTCTGVAVPGDPQHSYANIRRAGFRETYIRDNYAPPRR
jgi:GNAT superfamily N-acetyltransferase